tara:strand:- start:758 stop:1081 length:324 start_codon:yes stop_codon:yes gene_type:complete
MDDSEEPDVTNRFLAKLFSYESLTGLVILAFVLGVAGTELSADIEANSSAIERSQNKAHGEIEAVKDTQKEIKAQVKENGKELGEIKADISGIEAKIDILLRQGNAR